MSAVSWDGGGGDLNWNTPENWSGDALPGSDDDVTIDIPGINAAVFNASGTIHSLTSSEEIVIQGGTLDIAASSSIASLTQFGGTLTGTGDIDVAGDYVWRTGTLSGTSTLTVHGGLKLQESGAFNNDWHLSGRTLVNLGSGHATGLFGPEFTTARMFFHEGAEFQNAGSFSIETTVGMRFILADGTGSRIVNSGSFTNATSDVSTVQGIAFENSGNLVVPIGQLQLAGGGTSTGDFIVGGGATLFASGDFSATSDITGAGDLTLYNATQSGTVNMGGDVTLLSVTIAGDFNVAGDLSIPEGYGGTFNGTPATIGGNANVNRMFGTGDVTIAGLFTWNLNGLAQMAGTGRTIANGGLVFGGGGQAFLQQRTIENTGVAIWTGATVYIADNAQIINTGTFDIQSDGPFNSSSECPVFTNYGQLIKSAGNGTTFLNMMLVNSGSVVVQTGILNIGCGYVPDGGNLVGSVETSEIVNPGSFVVVPSPPIKVGNFTQTATGQLFEQIGGLIPGLEYGQIAVNGTVNLDGSLHVTLINGFAPHPGDQFTVINNQGTQPIVGTFVGLAEGDIIYSGLYGFSVSYVGGDGNDLVLTMDHLSNTPPVANIGGPYSVLEGGSVILTAAGSHDNEQAAITLTYDWDLDGDGIYGESGLNAGRGNEVGIAPMFSAVGLDGPSTFNVSVRVTDSYGQSDVANAIIAITNVAPTITTLVSSNADLAHKSLTGNVTINGTFFDPAQSFDTHTVQVNWGDGTPLETLPAVSVNQTLDTFQRTHHYATGGIFTIAVTVLDEDGGVSALATSTSVVTGVGLVNGTLYIIGTDGRDHVNMQYKQNQHQLTVDVKLNQGGSDGGSDGGSNNIQQTYQASSVTRVVAWLLDGDDHYNGGSDGGSGGGADIPMSQFVFGGAGKDQIQGGSGNDVLIGGTGDDDIQGGSGRDILIGGLGKDKLKGNAGDDLLIGGSAANENYLAALDQALADWASGNLAATLFDLGIITDDNNKDELFGEQGNDYLIGGVGDKLKQ